MTSSNAFAGPGSLTVSAPIGHRSYLTVDALFQRLGKTWTPRPDYDGRRFKRERVVLAEPDPTPTEFLPAWGTLDIPEPRKRTGWHVWLAIIAVVSAVLLGAVVVHVSQVPVVTDRPVITDTLVRAPQTLPWGVR